MRVISLMVCFIFIFYAAAFAHPPQEITITYDPATRVLKAVIKHNVSNTANHYIKKVDIALNGTEIIEHRISKQDNPESQTVTYLIPDARAGDRLSVEAYCSITGKLEKEIEIK